MKNINDNQMDCIVFPDISLYKIGELNKLKVAVYYMYV